MQLGRRITLFDGRRAVLTTLDASQPSIEFYGGHAIKRIAELPDCGVDVRILQVLVLSLQVFDQVGVSDINRKCTGQIEGAGTASSHYFESGGLAVDFYRLNGQGLTGADGNSLRLSSTLDPVMPDGARVGQVACRAEAGTTIATTHFTQFDDTCTHLHIDVGFTDGTLTAG